VFVKSSVKTRILFENDTVLVINKVPGEDSESCGIKTDWEDGKFPAPVHRLDVPVSGCLLLARTPEAASFLGTAFAQPAGGNGSGSIEKKYWAIIEMPEIDLPPEGELIHWLWENGKANKAFTSPWTETPPKDSLKRMGPKKAVLRYRVSGKGDRYQFLEIDLVTGRHHQIRAQLAALGLHIKGDLKYGARRSEKGGGIRLHAFSLAFPDPLDPVKIIRVKALPPVMDALWEAFAASNG